MKVNPSNLKISNIEKRSRGTLLIEAESSEDREMIKAAISKEMGNEYDIKVPNESEMTLKISGISSKYTDLELIEKLKKQNATLQNSVIKPFKYFETKRSNMSSFTAILAIDKASYVKVLKEGKVNVGWDKCRVSDGTQVLICYKCRGFNHKASECKNNESCY